jgi:hypothetical protein
MIHPNPLFHVPGLVVRERPRASTRRIDPPLAEPLSSGRASIQFGKMMKGFLDFFRETF